MEWQGWYTVQVLFVGGVFTALTKIAWDWWRDR